MAYAIEAEKLVKKYGKKVITDNVTIKVEEGEIYGLVGRNGAGKTSLMRLLLGLTTLNSGKVKLLGEDNLEQARLKTGAIIETPSFYDDMTVKQNLTFRAMLVGVTDIDNKIDELLNLVGLPKEKNSKIKTLSLGMRQKIGIATALINNPKLLILDEPINGLDPVAIVEVRRVLKKVNRENGTTILISSHILGEMEKLATRYGFIVDGKLVSEISAQEVQSKNIDLEKYALKMMGVEEDDE